MEKIKKSQTKASLPKSKCKHHHLHPDHKKEAVRLKRVKGQIEGILSMIENRRYCPDILIQIRASKAAIQAVELSILKTHLDNCVSEAIMQKDESKAKEKIDEIISLIQRHK